MDTDNQKKAIQAWIKSSDEDFDVAAELFKSGKYAHSLFFCQLTLEKLLKAIYIKNNDSYPIPTHDLVNIALKSNLELDQKTLDSLAEITTFNIEARYDIFKDKLYKKATKKFTTEYFNKTRSIVETLKKLS